MSEYNKQAVNELYSELLDLLDRNHYTEDGWNSIFNEKDPEKMLKSISENWKLFEDTPSDDPNINHRFNRDYLWSKIFTDPSYYKPTGIHNPADYLPAMRVGDAYEKQTVYEDIDDDGDIDKVTVEEKA